MAENMTEDEVRDKAREILGLNSHGGGVTAGVGQLTTFNQLGFKGKLDKPDGWYLPANKSDTAVVLETKASKIALGASQVKELLKNIRIMNAKYEHVVGILYNGESTRVFKNGEEYKEKGSEKLHNIAYYTALFNVDHIDKQRIYELTARINNCLHFEFGIRNLYHRMIFTACALVAKRYDALMVSGMDYSEFHNAILNCLNKELLRDKHQNQKLGLLADVFSEIRMNLNVNSEDEKEQEHVKDLISIFIDWVTEISDCLNSDAWRGEDVMGIFFNEFNRYKKKSESGQVFTPEHITDFMYKILEVNQNDRVLDATCGSGGFLVKAMANMIDEAGGVNTEKAKEIKQNQLFGIEFDREIYALACANMLIHKDGKTNLEQLDARSEEAGKWISSQNITKVLMNPPFERKYGCMDIVENVLDNVPPHTPCAFIMPDKKLEKTGKKQKERILKKHRLKKVIKLPEDLFFGIGITASIFVFEAGVPQDDKEFFACYMKSDGLATVKNKGRHDVYGKWAAIEKHWVEVIERQSGEDTCQWMDPAKHLSYQMPQKPFEIFEEDFRKTAMDYLMFQQDIDSKALGEKLLEMTLYSSRVNADGETVTVTMLKGDNDDDED
ncbi:HsdM family class I SAM-dependent methyltransferase [Bifidobacterium pseudocatenulatum]|uniref:HsdM family class I SAM-dependent methyltransferase n=1 Tax=Bifidobacterium pseudocatenulatum TaxID=28026 RepID=UPI001CFE95C1|nr:N-6 DNA methylase [Bifidobacterium pseudocatenulatum]MCB4911623.1 SAM-dependent methyltransferase [Bifidobacterium pseudocatenulatum]